MTYIATYGADSLQHHGILGQKWGVRRYQNPDGTLTAAGKKRQQKDNYKAIKRFGADTDEGHDVMKRHIETQGIEGGAEAVATYKKINEEYAELKKKYAAEIKEKLPEARRLHPDYFTDDELGDAIIAKHDDVKEWRDREVKAFSQIISLGKKAANEFLGKYSDELVDGKWAEQKKTMFWKVSDFFEDDMLNAAGGLNTAEASYDMIDLEDLD